jgi:hypothetical protein
MVVWRFSLEDPLTGQRHGFASLKALTDWLSAELYPTGRESGSAGPDTAQ